MPAFIPKKVRMLPIRYAQIYLWTTFCIFLTSDFIGQLENITYLVFFIAAAYSMLYLGYLFGIKTKKDVTYSLPGRRATELKLVRWIVIAGSLYFFVWGVNQIIDFGGRGLGDVLASIINPGASYKAKFDVYEYRLNTGAVNRITQVLILFSFIYAIFIPILVFYWRSIDVKWRVISVISVLIYVASFLYIGTQKGLGDVFLLLIAGGAVLLGSSHVSVRRTAKRKIAAIVVLVFSFAFFYMAYNQSTRATEFGISESFMFGDVSASWLSEVVGEPMAFGIYSILSYPSHGYAGLAFNLNQDFLFSHGAGFSPAFESYRLQYFGGNDNFYLTYPARTEVVTGWPAGLVWATAFPWIASDLTFAGAAIFMFFIGFLFARAWLRCISKQDILAFAILGQIFIFIAFLPANNQVLMGRQGLWVVISIVAMFVLRKLYRRKA